MQRWSTPLQELQAHSPDGQSLRWVAGYFDPFSNIYHCSSISVHLSFYLQTCKVASEV